VDREYPLPYRLGKVRKGLTGRRDMKRHPSLREFSDDHHQGLVNARRLRRAAS
jgi:hypothetical protein